MLALLLMSGVGGMGMVMAYYGKVFMRQLDEKVQLLDGKLKALQESIRPVTLSQYRRMDEGMRDRSSHLVQSWLI